MRIGIDARVLMDLRYSGVSEYARQLLAALFRIDQKNEYALWYNSFRDVAARLPDFRAPKACYRQSAYPNKVFNYFLSGLLGHPRLDRLAQCDIFFLPHINYASFSPGFPYILTVHDLSFLRWPEFYSARKRFWHRFLGLKKLAQGAARVVAISQSTKADVIELLGVPEERVAVVLSAAAPGFRPLPAGDPDIHRVRAKYGLDINFVLCLGNLEPRKNIEGAIAAFDAFLARRPDLKSLCLAVAGAPGWKGGGIRRAWEDSPNRGRIRFLGYVDEADRNILYNS
jgi:glycosyltransferase involved in cell wall biosynthesis